MITGWQCDCENKRNSMGLARCRKCGALRPGSTGPGQSIAATRETAPAARNRANTTQSRPRRPDADGGENFIESTIKFKD